MFKIGVIIPSYNRKSLLLRAIRSLQKQSFDRWEAYVVDDCSDDDIHTFLKEEGIFDDERIHFQKLRKNSGVNRVRNLALESILSNHSITHVTFLDDDDYFMENYLLEARELIQNQEIKWLLTACVKEDGKKITVINQTGEVDYLSYLLGETVMNDATMMIDKSLLNDIRFTQEYKNGYEWYFFLQLSLKTNMYVADIPSKVVTYLETGLSRKKRKRDRGKRAFQKRAFKECSYNYYRFLARKHKKHKIKHYAYLCLSWIYDLLYSGSKIVVSRER
jgi:glycosyltransferase involved in cell wall biosynthesis